MSVGSITAGSSIFGKTKCPKCESLPQKYGVVTNRPHLSDLLLLRWRYSPPGWALAPFTIRLQASRSLALSLNSFIPIFLRSVDTSSSHLIFGLPLRVVACSFPYNKMSDISCVNSRRLLPSDFCVRCPHVQSPGFRNVSTSGRLYKQTPPWLPAVLPSVR